MRTYWGTPFLKILNEQPPILDKLLKAGLKPQKTTVFAYGDTLYNPSGVEIPPDILIHEEVHIRQQKDNKDDCLEKYLNDKEYRLKVEVEAFREQYKFVCEMLKDRNDRAKCLHSLAQELSGSVYGKIINYSEAINKLK